MSSRLRQFFAEDLWITDGSGKRGFRPHLYRQLQLTTLVFRKFWDDNCLLRAAGLTYTTLLSLVPLLALMFAILKGLGIQRVLEPVILERLTAGSQALAERILVYVDRINVGSLGTLGITFLFATVILVLTNVEMAFNAIWQVDRGRSWLRKCSDYLGLLVILPVAIFATLSLTTFVKNHTFTRELLNIGLFGQLYVWLLKLAPFFVMWLAFSILYLFMPNTKVNPVSASAGGIIGGTLWQLSQWAYIHYQSGLKNYSAIYGALSQLPVLLIWIFLSWVILLLGAEVVFAHQNLTDYRRQQRWRHRTVKQRGYWALRTLLAIGDRFKKGLPPHTVTSLSDELGMPEASARAILSLLEHLGLISYSGCNGETILPLKDLGCIQVFDLVEAVEGHDPAPGATPTGGFDRVVLEVLEKMRQHGKSGLGELTVAQLLNSLPGGDEDQFPGEAT